MNLSSPAYHLPPAVGLLRLAGPDRISFLQRQTTNDVRPISTAHAVTTVLTSPTARILDVLQLFDENDILHILSLHPETTYTYLRRRIFFNDQVTLTNATADALILDLEGEHAADWLRAQGFDPPPLEGTVTGTLVGSPVRMLGQPGLKGIGYRMIAPAGTPLIAHLQTVGLSALSPEEYEICRVEAGLPAPGHELTEDYTPHETNLAAWISETKGCYTGQEILARQVTYDKITRHLAGLQLDAPVLPGANVLADGKSAGSLTSVVVSPRFGPIALAILKRPSHEPGTEVVIETESGPVNAKVVSFPFL
ncbi:MAG TPA: glycine cleavage T C-terminal barrel domain-containing protein [Anaerolineales bacterium]|nr:glycine cleavage T C-terminal barrel domain-containing protein [Anaerolineales bacterium]